MTAALSRARLGGRVIGHQRELSNYTMTVRPESRVTVHQNQSGPTG
jgi:hypothetical protein